MSDLDELVIWLREKQKIMDVRDQDTIQMVINKIYRVKKYGFIKNGLVSSNLPYPDKVIELAKSDPLI